MTFPIALFEPSNQKEFIHHQSDTSRLASVNAPANAHFTTGKSFDSCMEAALAAPGATFLVKTSSSNKPVIVHGANECRSMIAGVINKVHGIHQGMKKPALVFGIDIYNFFKKIDAAEPLNFDSIGDLLSSVTFNEAKTVTDGEKVIEEGN